MASPRALSPASPRRGGRIAHWTGRVLLALIGWKIEGRWPDEPKLVIVGAPHTSNWDLILAIGMMTSQNLGLNWMMKKEAFHWSVAWLWRALGGIPIDRKAAGGVVEQTSAWFRKSDRAYLGITPEGTRSKVGDYRKGYLRMAYAAEVPVFIAGVDGTRKTLVLDRVWPLTGDIDADNAAIAAYVRTNYGGMKPHQS